MADGYQENMDIQMQMLAWHAANLMNIHLERSVTADQLLGKDKPMNQQDKEAKFGELVQLMQRKGA
jgi:hypothetical protein